MKKAKKKTGRPLIPIDPKVVEGMASVGATNQEIADFVGCDGDTIGRRFADILTKGHAGLKTRLRQAQIKYALAGNPALLIFLGKQMLGQTDRRDLELSAHESLADLLTRIAQPRA